LSNVRSAAASFGTDNGGAIPSNLLQIPNSDSNSQYLAACKALEIKAHPARFPAKLPEFFIRLLTEPGDLVVDIFAGSNTTGMVAEAEGRCWAAFEADLKYVAASAFRFRPKELEPAQARAVSNRIVGGEELDLRKYVVQASPCSEPGVAIYLAPRLRDSPSLANPTLTDSA
jgi:site-specific DNA-methyltransferase (cytosine-N4-specific)